MSARPITEDDLHAYVDGMLDAARRAEVSVYLDAHPDVADRVESYAVQRLDLHKALDPITDEPIPTRLNLAHMIEAPRRRTMAPWRMAAAAAVLLVAGGTAGWWLHGLSQPPAEGVIALAREASDSFGTYAQDHIRPVELLADESDKLVSWATERLGHAAKLPDLSASGYRFMGGRMISTSHGPGLMLMYDDDHGSRLVMVSRPMVVDQDSAMARHSEGETNGWTWATDGMGYSLVGKIPSETLHPLADEVRRQVVTSS